MIPFSITNDDTQQVDTYFLPESWADVKWEQYIDFKAAEARKEFEGEDYDVTIAQVSALTRAPESNLKDLPFSQVLALREQLLFTEQDIKVVPVAAIRLGRDVYHAQQLYTWGELTARDRIMSDENHSYESRIIYQVGLLLRKQVENPVKKAVKSWLNKLVPTSYHPEESKIACEPYPNDLKWVKTRGDLFAKTLNVEQVAALNAFFLSITIELPPLSLPSSRILEKVLSQKEHLEKLFGQSLAGTRPSGTWSRIQFTLMRSYIRLLTKYLRVSSVNV